MGETTGIKQERPWDEEGEEGKVERDKKMRKNKRNEQREGRSGESGEVWVSQEMQVRSL